MQRNQRDVVWIYRLGQVYPARMVGTQKVPVMTMGSGCSECSWFEVT